MVRYCFSMWVLIIALIPVRLYAQATDTSGLSGRMIELDSFVIRSGFDVQAFIKRVRTDTTFYKSFKSLHLVPYKAIDDIKVLGKDGAIEASMHRVTQQEIHNRCRSMKVLEDNVTGRYYKRNGDYNYYTSKLFAHLFFTLEPKCNENDIVSGSLDIHGTGQLNKSEYELKQLIFNPGAKVSGVPLMGDRASIFDEGEAEKYDFKIRREDFNGVQCYMLQITPKAGYERRVLYNELTTWFRITDYRIVARNYSLSYHTIVYDFDVTMKVRTCQVNGKLMPAFISYDGNWHVFTQKRERVKFTVDLAY